MASASLPNARASAHEIRTDEKSEQPAVPRIASFISAT